MELERKRTERRGKKEEQLCWFRFGDTTLKFQDRNIKAGFHLRNSNLSRSVVVETEGAALQHLEAESLTLVSIYVH